MPSPCNSTRRSDTPFQTCQPFCKLEHAAQHCQYCKCRQCLFCQPPEKRRSSPFLTSSAYGAAAPLHPAELNWRGDEHSCYGRNRPQRFSGPFQPSATASHPKLLVTGPVDDGFWVRGLHVFALYGWARRQSPRVPIQVAFNSTADAYYNASVMGPNAWAFYFEPVDHAPPAPTFELPCTRVYELMLAQRYATSFREVVRQRAERSQLWRELGIRPRPRFAEEAQQFWESHFGASRPVLGVHFRGVDKRTSPELATRYVALTRAYLVRKPRAQVFVATDSASFFASFTATLHELRVPYASRSALRSDSSSPVFKDRQASSLQVGTDVLLDTLLLSRCDFLIKGISMVSEFAIYMNMRLNASSYDTVLRGQPPTLLAARQASPAADRRRRVDTPDSEARDTHEHAATRSTPLPSLSPPPPPLISYIIQYYRHPSALLELVRRLQHPRVEVVVHADSNTSADVVAFAAVATRHPQTVFVHSSNLHELRGYNKAVHVARGSLLAFAQDDTLPPPDASSWVDALLGIFERLPELAVLGLHRGGTLWRGSSERPKPRADGSAATAGDATAGVGASGATSWPTSLGGWWCNASQSRVVAPTPPLVFASWLSLDPILVRASRFEALGGFDEAYSAPGAPAMGMEKDLVARAWRRGWSSAVLCPSKLAMWIKDCGTKGTTHSDASRATRDVAARTNRELLLSRHNRTVGRAIEARVRSRNAWLHAPVADVAAREAASALRELWPGCVSSCAGLLSVAHKAAVANAPVCRANGLQ